MLFFEIDNNENWTVNFGLGEKPPDYPLLANLVGQFSPGECISCGKLCWGVRPEGDTVRSYCCPCGDDDKTEFSKSLYCILCQEKPRMEVKRT